MKIAIVGGGAMGTLLGAHLSSGNSVTIVEKGCRADFIRRNGFRVLQPNGSVSCFHPHKVSDRCAGAGPQDYVFLAVKAYDLPGVAEEVGHLLGDSTAVVTIQNGIPWWYFENYSGKFQGSRLKSLDPENGLANNIDVDRIIGCVAYPAAEMLGDGTVKHVEGYRFPVGELNGQVNFRTKRLVQVLLDAGFKSRAIPDIRSEYWLKAWGALSINPISALTRGKMDAICNHAPTRKLIEMMMTEAQSVAQCLGVTFRHTIEKRIEGAKSVGPHKTSMLCDLEAGRQLETEALIGSIIELAEITGQPVPAIRAVYACLSLLAENATGNRAQLEACH